MPKSQNQKMKLLYLIKIFNEKTDEKHPISMPGLIEELARYGVNAERKSMYDDIECLQMYGMDIIYKKMRPAGYYLGKREFEIAELKLLVDSVQSSKFITARKSQELIKKLEGLTSHYEAGQLQRQVYVNNRPKTMNESIYYNVDKIHTAIAANSAVKFMYTEWTIEKKLEPRHNKRKYNVSPWALVWDDENYYLVGYDEDNEQIRHYRVDKMIDIRITEIPRNGAELFDNFDVAQFGKKTFGMFGGVEKNVTLRCSNSLIGVIIDRFGKDVHVLKDDGEHFTAHVKVTVSQQFFGWLVGLGSGVCIASPQDVKNAYIEHLKGIIGDE